MHASDIPGINELSIQEKIQLVEEIWDAIVKDESAAPVPLSHQVELDRRLAKYKSGDDRLLSIDELKANIKQRL